jgi:hypothetical protein
MVASLEFSFTPQAQVQVLVNQEGSLDLQPSGSSNPHVEVVQEAQSMERNDIQLITTENPFEVPEWVVLLILPNSEAYLQ